VSARRDRARRRRPIISVARVRLRPGRAIWIVIPLALLAGAAASGYTTQGAVILAAVQRFMLFYSGVLALVALTAAVGVGIVAADRVVMAPAARIVAQAVHRAVSLAALAFLVTHVALEILAHRSHVIDALVPFLARGRTFYLGLGTIASDLVVLVVASGIARGRFAARPWSWRVIHATAYLAWPLSTTHGLLAGRTARPYVDWSYGACLAAVGLALLVRLAAAWRHGRRGAVHPVPDRVSSPSHGALATVPLESRRDLRSAMPRAGRAPRALPSSGEPRGRAVPYPPSAPYPHPGQWRHQPPGPEPSEYPAPFPGEGS